VDTRYQKGKNEEMRMGAESEEEMKRHAEVGDTRVKWRS
jgi:hypothetical protein